MLKKYNVERDSRDSLQQWYENCYFLGPDKSVDRVSRINTTELRGRSREDNFDIKDITLIPTDLGFIPSKGSFFGVKYLHLSPIRQYKRGMRGNLFTRQEAAHAFTHDPTFEVATGIVYNRHTFVSKDKEIVFYRGLLITNPELKRIVLDEIKQD